MRIIYDDFIEHFVQQDCNHGHLSIKEKTKFESYMNLLSRFNKMILKDFDDNDNNIFICTLQTNEITLTILQNAFASFILAKTKKKNQ